MDGGNENDKKRDSREKKTHGKANGHAPPHSLTPIQHGLLTQPQILPALGILPRDDGGTVEQHADGFAGGERSRDAVVGRGELHRGLRVGGLPRRGDGGGAVGAVDHSVRMCCCFLLGWMERTKGDIGVSTGRLRWIEEVDGGERG